MNQAGRRAARPPAIAPEAALWCDPSRQGGAVCVMGTRIPTNVIADLVYAGDDLDQTAADYDITRRQTLVSCWWEATNNPDDYRGWKTWAGHARQLLWVSDGPLPDDPLPEVPPPAPTRKKR